MTEVRVAVRHHRGRVPYRMPVRQRVGRVVDLVAGDWWAPNRRVAAAVLLLVAVLVAVVGLTLGWPFAALVTAAGVTMRVCSQS